MENPNKPEFYNKLYNGIWEINGYSQPYEYEEASRISFYDNLLRLPFFDGEGKILDVGCGMGGIFSALPPGNKFIKFGIDFSHVAIEKLKRRIPDGTFVVGDVHALPFENDCFLKVICTETLEHVDKPFTVIAEMFRILQGNGKLLITVPEKSLDLPSESWPGGISVHINQFTVESLSAMVCDNGFVIDSTEIIDREIWLIASKPKINDKCRRTKTQYSLYDVNSDIQMARKLFGQGSYLDAFDRYEQLADAYPEHTIEILAEAFDKYETLPDKHNRYHLYQARHFDFGIQSSDKVLDIGSGHLPFPFATHLADLALEDGNVGRAGIPFKYLDGKPVYECNIEKLPFADKEFDFVYCSHVLEHTDSPENACRELMRVAKRGYIETPTRGKDLWLNTAEISNHRWAVECVHQKLVFTEYIPHEIQGLNCNILMSMHCSPQTLREKAFSALVYLKADLVNTMVYWEGQFEFEVRRLASEEKPAAPVSFAASTPPGGPVDTLGVAVPFSCIFLNTYYDGFLSEHYLRNSVLAQCTYQEQKLSLQDSCFGDSDFYSEGMKKAGWQAEDLILNCRHLQDAWARENGKPSEGLAVAVEQIRLIKPRVVYLQNLGLATKQFLAEIRPHTDLIVGQIACPIPSQTDISGLDIIFSSFPHFVERFRAAGITSYYQPLAFEPRVLKSLTHFAYQKRPVECSFIGGISPMHGKGYQLLEQLAVSVPIHFWGYGAETLPPGSAIRNSHHGEVWGQEMFYLLGASRITINRHIDVAENHANNMRLFEATGCGALLITDYKDNLNELFEIGQEVVAYRSPEECAELIKYYLAHPVEAERIASAGQARTLRDHTYDNRMKQTAEILERHLRYRREKDRFPAPDLAKISYGHAAIAESDITPKLTSAWQDASIPDLQRALVQKELAEMYQGRVPVVFQVVADALMPHVAPGSSVLEIGCASGYYYEILEYLLGKRIDYTGVDYSEPLITMARDYYPTAKFFIADGASLFFADRQFHMVVSSSVLLHVPNWRQHIFETARVAARFVVAHRTPICRRKPTQYLKKFAYGVETVQFIFNEEEFIREFTVNGLSLIRTLEYHSNLADDSYEVTYLFRKDGIRSIL
ncbi:methyltransferase domain-containing protein [Pelotalea chapellei]|uniref:Methyltransferase domain-containing protein n=1 Tax=Pelotalea chapellei TaxID=44671 RepID=A0ABS5UAL4_9BACT|nr:methyltransferase domain-containing protein [Pelotalea chapellei]MBT1072724.1 methyltransferase domain-containing protein [Pelotalea chapellei]